MTLAFFQLLYTLSLIFSGFSLYSAYSKKLNDVIKIKILTGVSIFNTIVVIIALNFIFNKYALIL